MKHLGDISKINGTHIEPVDLITFGSPCQDLSVAGKRAGMKHEANGDGETTRSGLFIEAVRIIKEMREATNGKYPRFALWENVPGAFSSNKGEDFRTVLEEIIQIIEPEASMPAVPKMGWAYADCYGGDGWSLAYRVLDTQYWPRTPQRRRRIYLVADFGGERAKEILFEREGLRGDFASGGAPWQRTSADAEGSIGAADSTGVEIGSSAGFKAGQGVNARGIGWEEEQTPTLASENGGNSVPSVCCKTWDAHGNESSISDYTNVVCIQGNVVDYGVSAKCNGKGWKEDVGYTLNTMDRPAVVYGIGNGQVNQSFASEQAGTLNCMHDQQAICYQDTVGSLCARDYKGVGSQYTDEDKCIVERHSHIRYIVRRLTPTECARLQGFPDGWGKIYPKTSFTPDEYNFWLGVRKTHAEINGKQVRDYTQAQMLAWYKKLHTDSAEYKMWGNGIALPTALYCMQGIAEVLHENGYKRPHPAEGLSPSADHSAV